MTNWKQFLSIFKDHISNDFNEYFSMDNLLFYCAVVFRNYNIQHDYFLPLESLLKNIYPWHKNFEIVSIAVQR